MKKISKVRSGGQSGVDRAALDTARGYNIDICGWCPKGGWAEDYTTPPGVLKLYPELKETPLDRVEQRTVWNVRDSDATLIINLKESDISLGTELTQKAAIIFKKPYLAVCNGNSAPEVIKWLLSLDDDIVLNVGGPRESECQEAYKKTVRLLSAVFEYFDVFK